MTAKTIPFKNATEISLKNLFQVSPFIKVLFANPCTMMAEDCTPALPSLQLWVVMQGYNPLPSLYNDGRGLYPCITTHSCNEGSKKCHFRIDLQLIFIRTDHSGSYQS